MKYEQRSCGSQRDTKDWNGLPGLVAILWQENVTTALNVLLCPLPPRTQTTDTLYICTVMSHKFEICLPMNSRMRPDHSAPGGGGLLWAQWTPRMER